jgi:hypothetical protein
VFDQFLPVRIDSDYNAFTCFNVIMDHCKLRIVQDNSATYNCVVHIPQLVSTVNERPELQDKCVPNIRINDLQIILPTGVTTFYFLKIDILSYTGNVKGANVFIFNDVSYCLENGGIINATFYDSNRSLTLTEPYAKSVNSIIHNIS